jgi:transposase
MKKVIKQVVGMDVAKDELVVCLGYMYDDLSASLVAHKTFANQAKGFKELLHWVSKQTNESVAVHYVMEATGVYHESLAYHLDELGQRVSVVLPNKISNYARSLTIKTVTDKTASEAITRFGLERQLEQWHRPNGLYKKVKQLTRERSQLIDERTMLKNQLHAEKSEAEPSKKSIERMQKRIVLLNKQDQEIGAELKALIATDEEMQKMILLLCSIPGVGLLTAATVLAETNGFDLIRNKRQLTSYAGLDVQEKQSGISVRGKSRISKKGNKHLRQALHMPALAAIRHDERMKAIFARLVSKHGIKMKAAVAVQRKLLEMMFTLFKKQTTYDKNYFQNQNQSTMLAETEVVCTV